MDLASFFAASVEAARARSDGSQNGTAVPAVPVPDESCGNGQAIENKQSSRSSRSSRRPKWAWDFSQENSNSPGSDADACADAAVRARGYGVEQREIREQRELLAGSDTYSSRSLFLKRELIEETGTDAPLRVLLTLASDPDVQLAFDERAAFLEYECGLSRAEAEAQAANEILPGLPPASPAPIPAPPAGSDRAVWTAGLARLTPHRAPCPDYRGDEWPRVLANAHAFLDTFGAQAEGLGWRTHELFGVHPEIGTVRPDYCGALTLGVGGPVRLVTAGEIRFGDLTHRRLPGQPQGVPIWEFGR